jgi:dUTP pyrophosphatase
MIYAYVKFAKTSPDESIRNTTRIPSRKEGDAGFDIYANFSPSYTIIRSHETVMIPTGIASSIASNFVFILKERGSTGSLGIGQRCGVIDSSYRGEWFVPITNHNKMDIIISKLTEQELICQIDLRNTIIYPYSKAICQAIVVEVPITTVEEISYDELKSIPSDRGQGMLGSSGK